MTAILARECRRSYETQINSITMIFAVRPTRELRSGCSATAKTLPDASFAGQQETYLNIEGWANVAKNVQKCWASLFGARAIFYRSTNKFSHLKVGIAVPVQLMVQSEISGIMFTVNPLTNDRERSIY